MTSDRRIFLKQLGLGAVGLSVAASFPESLAAQPAMGQQLPRSTPEAQGVSSAELLNFLEAVGKSQHEFHSFMLVRHGQVIAEGWWSPYAADLNHMLYSLSKSFTSTAVGWAVSEGRLKVEDPVLSFFPNDLPASISEHLAALKVKHLLTMSVGHAEDSTPIITRTDNWVKTFLALPIENPPGSTFLYNSGATYMLSAIIQKLTGQKVINYLGPRLFQPLAIEGMTWETCPRGINTGGWGLAIQTEGLAKFGQLYLQKGVWNGKQILPATWIEEATTFKIQQPPSPGQDLAEAKKNSEWHQGYGYQFWRTRHDAYRADGAFGQYTIVLPNQDAVICITGESSSMAGEFDLMWQYLLPAMKENVLLPDPVSQARLKQKLASLALLPPKAQATSPVAAMISGKTFKIEDNAKVRSVAFKFQGNTCTFTLKDTKGEHPITCGIEKWADGKTDMPGTPPKLTVGALGPVSKVLASGTWKDENTFQMTWQFYQTPHHDTVTCRFDGNKVKIGFLSSVAEKNTGYKETRPVLLGKIAA